MPRYWPPAAVNPLHHRLIVLNRAQDQRTWTRVPGRGLLRGVDASAQALAAARGDAMRLGRARKASEDAG